MKKLILYISLVFTSFSGFAQRYTTFPIVNQNTASVPTAYLYYKWEITEIRNHSLGFAQAAELNLYNSSSELDYSSSSYTTGGCCLWTCYKLYDNDGATKYEDYSFGSNGVSVTTIQLNSAQAIDSYSYTTGSDTNGRDPIDWNLYGSNNGSDWDLLDSQTSQTITTSRSTETQIWTLP